MPSNTTCVVCDRTLSSMTRLQSHMNIHRDFKPYKCMKCNKMECNKMFFTKDGLSRHSVDNCGKEHNRQDSPSQRKLREQGRSSPTHLKTAKEQSKKPQGKSRGKKMPSKGSVLRQVPSSKGNVKPQGVHMKRSSVGHGIFLMRNLNKQGTKRQWRQSEINVGGSGSHENDFRGLDISLQKHSSGKSSSAQRRFECHECGKLYLSRSGRDKHLRTHVMTPNSQSFRTKSGLRQTSEDKPQGAHPEETFRCRWCDKVYYMKTAVDRHRKICGRQNLWPCDVCDKTFVTENGRNLHNGTHKGNEKKSLRCDRCGDRFSSEARFCCHKQVCVEKSRWPCLKCDKIFSTQNGRNSHMRTHTEDKFRCDQCGDRFSSDAHLCLHKQLCTKKSRWLCLKCGKIFSTQNGRNSHMRTHKGDKFRCDQCGDWFSSEVRLCHHKQLCVKISRWLCLKCGKIFSTQNARNLHMRAHKGHKKFRCDPCGEWFSSQPRLSCHKQSCVAQVRWPCHRCDNSFSTENGRNSHMRIHKHDKRDNKSFRCDRCDERFSTKVLLYGHRQVCVKQVGWLCHDCDKMFSTENGRNTHMRIHKGDQNKSFRCDQCGEPFKSEARLCCHSQVCLELSSWSCHRCKKTFSTENGRNSHMRIHKHDKGNGERKLHAKKQRLRQNNWSCDRCRKTFSTQNGRKSHMRIHKNNMEPLTSSRKSCSIKRRLNGRQKIHLRQISPCKICGKTFSAHNGIYSHLQYHKRKEEKLLDRKTRNAQSKKHKNNEWKNKCSLCGNFYSSSSHLKRHEKLHEKCKLQKLRSAKSSFRKKASKFRLHNKKRDFPCKVCGKRFRSPSNLDFHGRSHNHHGEDANSYICGHCGVGFSKEAQLRRHLCVCKFSLPYKTAQYNTGSPGGDTDTQRQINDPTDNHSDADNQRPVNDPAVNQSNADYQLDGRQINDSTENQGNKDNQRQIQDPKDSQRKADNQRQIQDPADGQGDENNQGQVNGPADCYKDADDQRRVNDPAGNQGDRDSQRPVNDRLFKCDVCRKPFDSVPSLKEHRIVHKAKRPFKCDKCRRSFLFLNEKLEHMQSH